MQKIIPPNTQVENELKMVTAEILNSVIDDL
jgi:hypothetical protein